MPVGTENNTNIQISSPVKLNAPYDVAHSSVSLAQSAYPSTYVDTNFPVSRHEEVAPQPCEYRSSAPSNIAEDTSEAYVSRTLYICKLPPDFTEAQIHAVCAPFGDLRKITCYPSRQIAFAEYWDIRDAQRARNDLKDVYIGGRLVEIQYSKTKDDRSKDRNTGTLYVRPLTTERNFHDPNTLQQYKELFSRYGEVKKVNTNRKREAEKFIEYHDLRAAEAALQALNGSDFNGVRLEVQFANQSSKTLNKEGLSEYTAPVANVQRRGFRRDSSNPSSYGPIRTHFAALPSEPPPPTGIDRWGLPVIHMRWYGTLGPTALATSKNPGSHNPSVPSPGATGPLTMNVTTTASTTGVENPIGSTNSNTTNNASVVVPFPSSSSSSSLSYNFPSPQSVSSTAQPPASSAPTTAH